MKKFLILILVMVTILTGCTLIQAKRYSQEFRPIIEELIQWDKEYNDVADEWLENSQFFSGYNYQLNLFYKDDRLIQALIDPLDTLKADGQNILNIIGIITPPEDISNAHEQVVACIKSRIQFMEKISSYISAWEPIDYPQTISDLSTCLTFNAALTKIVSYINSH